MYLLQEDDSMKRLIYNENTKQIDVVEEDFSSKEKEEKKSRRVKTWLENNKVFFEIFSFVFVGIMGIAISFIGLKFNKTAVDIYQKQLEITENDKKPRFYIKCDYLSATNNRIGIDGKTTKCYYSIGNKGEEITQVSMNPESYVFFYIPTNIEREYYIFKFRSNDFCTDGGNWIETIEKDKEYMFAEYIFKDEGMSEWMAIAKIVSEYFPEIKCVHKNIVNIRYTDYIGEEKEEIFIFNDRDIKKSSDEESCIPLENHYESCLDKQKTGEQEVKDAAEGIKKGIKDWIKNNKGVKGYEVPNGTRFEYIG